MAPDGQGRITMIDRLKAWARRLQRDIVVLAVAIRDPRTPWYAKLLGVAVIAYALSPIDLIPDFIPVLGYLDDLLLLPLALWLLAHLIPAHILSQHRSALEAGARLPPNRTAAVIVVAIWIFTAVILGRWLWQRLGPWIS